MFPEIETRMTNAAVWLFGPAWQSTLVGFVAFLFAGAEAAPGLFSGHPTHYDWGMAIGGALVAGFGRALPDAAQVQRLIQAIKDSQKR